MKLILFDKKEAPEVGELFVVKRVFSYTGRDQQRRIAVELEKIHMSAGVDFSFNLNDAVIIEGYQDAQTDID